LKRVEDEEGRKTRKREQREKFQCLAASTPPWAYATRGSKAQVNHTIACSRSRARLAVAGHALRSAVHSKKKMSVGNSAGVDRKDHGLTQLRGK
jgi:hypothetical protein